MTNWLPKKSAFRQGPVVRCGIILWLFIAPSLVADKDSLFADDSEEVPIIPIEVDPDFEDDFAHIEMGPGMKTSGPYQSGFLITDSYDLFSAQGLVRREKSISVFGGNETIASRYHFTLFPQGHFEVWRMFGHVGVPLRFPVYDKVKKDTVGMRGRGFVDGETFITPRTADFRNAWDIQRLIRHLEINKATDPYFLRLSRSHSITLGHGELVRNMMPEGLYDHDMLFLSGHAYFDAVHLEAFAAPLFKTSMAGLSARFTPLSMINNAPGWVRDMNFDMSYVGDFAAPNHAQLSQDSFVLDKERRVVKREKGLVQGLVLGVAEEFRPSSWLGLKPYISWGNLWLSGLKNKDGDAPSSYGAGMHVGHEATFEFLPNKRSVLLFKSEGRLFSKNYYPGYFGSTYLIDRHQFNEPKDKSTESITKSQYVNSGGDQHARFGYLFELGYAYEDAFSTMLSYENARSFAQASIIPSSRKLQFVTTILGLDAVKLYLAYQATCLADFKELFDFNKSRALLSLRGQLKLLPFLYFDTWAKHSFGIYDMFSPSTTEGQAEPLWLSNLAETRSLNFGLGFEFAMTF